jgi:lysophospholipase L1-like esterase
MYLSLGDSLAAGDQPDANGDDRPTSAGYADVLGRRLRRVYPGLLTLKHSCAGGTTTSLLEGAGCPTLGPGSQVQQAERVLRSGKRVVLVTVNIGDNDVEGCVHSDARGIDAGCVARGRAKIARNLPVIIARLRAAGPDAQLVGIVDYDQFVAFWLRGPAGQSLARRSVRVISDLNALLTSIYRRANVPVADVSEEFATNDLGSRVRVAGLGVVPRSVARICALTWACAPPPVGFDDHANARGYRVIAQAVLEALAAATTRAPATTG